MATDRLLKIDRYLKYLILIGFILLFIVLNIYELHNCNLCSFEVEGEELNTEEFFIHYVDECLKDDMEQHPFKNVDASSFNFSFD